MRNGKNYTHTLKVDNATLNASISATIGPSAVGDKYITTDGIVRIVAEVSGKGLVTSLLTETVA